MGGIDHAVTRTLADIGHMRAWTKWNRMGWATASAVGAYVVLALLQAPGWSVRDLQFWLAGPAVFAIALLVQHRLD